MTPKEFLAKYTHIGASAIIGDAVDDLMHGACNKEVAEDLLALGKDIEFLVMYLEKKEKEHA